MPRRILRLGQANPTTLGHGTNSVRVSEIDGPAARIVHRAILKKLIEKDESQKKIYDYAKRHHNGIIILQNATTGAVRGIRFNRNGGGQWGKLSRLKEQVLEKHDDFTRLQEDVLDIMRNIVKKKQMQKVKFKDGKTASVDMFTASAMVKVYDALNKDNQGKFKDMINKNKNGFMAMQNFAMKSIR